MVERNISLDLLYKIIYFILRCLQTPQCLHLPEHAYKIRQNEKSWIIWKKSYTYIGKNSKILQPKIESLLSPYFLLWFLFLFLVTIFYVKYSVYNISSLYTHFHLIKHYIFRRISENALALTCFQDNFQHIYHKMSGF